MPPQKNAASQPLVPPLTEPQRRTLRAIEDFIRRRNYPPTMQELAAALGISGPTAHAHVGQLVRKGYLRRESRKARGLAVVQKAQDAVAKLVPVPLLGTVAAGLPILAEENVIGEVLVEGEIAGAGRCFALTVSGDSMQEAGIADGDVIIARQQPLAENGDIVVALVNGEATVKRLSIQDQLIELRPENKKRRPIVIGPDTDFRIVGKVVAWRRATGHGRSH